MNRYTYIESFDTEQMHEHSKEWFSELSFSKDEHQFLNNLILSFAVKPLEKADLKQLSDFKNNIAENQKELISLLKKVQKHLNQLEILIDDVDQLKLEKAYRERHKKLLLEVDEYLVKFRSVKQQSFSKLTKLLKKNKRMALGNPDYKLKTTQT